MKGQWKEVAKLLFKGQRYHDHALDLSAIIELSQFQKIVAETAKVIWRAENPNRKNLPKWFEDRTRLCLRRIDEGSAAAPLEVFIEEPENLELFEAEPTGIKKAIELAHQVFLAIDREEPLPEKFPRDLLPEYEKWGKELKDDEMIELCTDGKEPARVTTSTRSRLSVLTEGTHEDYIDIIGEVMEADIRLGRFQLWLDDKTYVSVLFSPEQENEVTTALRDHRTIRLHVTGKGDFSPQGKPLRINQVDKLQFQQPGEVPYDFNARPIEEVLAELASEVPEKEWEKLPSDLTDKLDQYLYGTQ